MTRAMKGRKRLIVNLLAKENLMYLKPTIKLYHK